MATNYNWPLVSSSFTPSGIQDVNITKVGGNAVGTSIPVTQGANTNGAITNATATTTSNTATSAPANAVGFILQSESTNSVNVRWTLGSTVASTTVGQLLEPGRDTGLIPSNANVNVCNVSSAISNFSIIWVLSS